MEGKALVYKPWRGGRHTAALKVESEEKFIETVKALEPSLGAEVPSQNQIAVRFYTKRGFRSLVQIFAARHQ